MREAVIVSAVRTAVGKAPRGTLKTTRPDDMAAVVIKEALKRAAPLQAGEVEDVIIGCAYPEAEAGLNVGRIASLRAGLPETVPGMTVNRFCSSGLQAIALAAQRIIAGELDIVIAGGTESMSMIPRRGRGFSPNAKLAQEWPGVYMSMGMTAENVAEQFAVSRQDADEFAYRSHTLASKAIRASKFADEIQPLSVGSSANDDFFDTDEGVRHAPDLEAMGKLKPVFKEGG